MERLKRIFSGRPCSQVWLPPRRGVAGLPRCSRKIARTLSAIIRPPTALSSGDVGQADGEIELAERAQHREQPNADRGAEDAAGEQHQAEREVDRAAGASS